MASSSANFLLLVCCLPEWKSRDHYGVCVCGGEGRGGVVNFAFKFFKLLYLSKLVTNFSYLEQYCMRQSAFVLWRDIQGSYS